MSECEVCKGLFEDECNTCKLDPDFKKKDIALLKSFRGIEVALGELEHDWTTTCNTCLELSEDEDYNIGKCRWRTQTSNEAVLIRDLHRAVNENHECEVKYLG